MLSLNDINQAALECFETLPENANLRLPVMLVLYGCSRATFYRLIKKGLIPEPYRLGERTSVWRAGETRASLKKLRNRPSGASGI